MALDVCSFAPKVIGETKRTINAINAAKAVQLVLITDSHPVLNVLQLIPPSSTTNKFQIQSAIQPAQTVNIFLQLYLTTAKNAAAFASLAKIKQITAPQIAAQPTTSFLTTNVFPIVLITTFQTKPPDSASNAQEDANYASQVD